MIWKGLEYLGELGLLRFNHHALDPFTGGWGRFKDKNARA